MKVQFTEDYYDADGFKYYKNETMDLPIEIVQDDTHLGERVDDMCKCGHSRKYHVKAMGTECNVDTCPCTKFEPVAVAERSCANCEFKTVSHDGLPCVVCFCKDKWLPLPSKGVEAKECATPTVCELNRIALQERVAKLEQAEAETNRKFIALKEYFDKIAKLEQGGGR